MKTRQLGKSNLHLTEIGLGAWAIGGPWKFGWGAQDDTLSLETISAALDLGINWIDTAAVYGLGHSERVVGQALKGRRDKVILATKCGLVWDDRGNVDRILNRKSVRNELENSLKRLNTDYIDLYQIHWPTNEAEHLEVWEEMARFVEEGKVRNVGVCNFSADQMRPLLDVHPLASLQPPFSMINQDIAADAFAFVKENGIGVVPYGVMHHGLLTGKYNAETVAQLPDDDWRKKGGQFTEPKLSANLKLVEGLKEVAGGRMTTGQLAIAWVLTRPEITSAIIGMRKPDQPKGIVPALDVTLSAAQLEEIDRLLAERRKAIGE
jgi:aryl-alcohol dehydrogenase-like predicted oxidoreductase